MDTLTTEAAEALAATSNEDLLRTFAQLTHRIHEVAPRLRSRDDRMAGAAVGATHSLRAQRDLIEAELLRRMGGQ